MKKTINLLGIGLSLILIILYYYYLHEIEKSKVSVTPLLSFFVNDSDQLTIQVGQYSLFIFIVVLFLFVKNITFQKKKIDFRNYNYYINNCLGTYYAKLSITH